MNMEPARTPFKLFLLSVLWATLVTGGLFLHGCAKHRVPSLSGDVQRIFDIYACGGCHGSDGCEALKHTSATETYNTTVGVPSCVRPEFNLTEPGEPSKSYLLKTLCGDQCEPPCDVICGPGTPELVGGTMPLFCTEAECLTAAEIQLVIDWIKAGAPNN